MNVAGPSKVRPSRPFQPNGKAESTYEQDLLSLLDQLTLQERDEFQMSLKRRIGAGGRLSDRDIALNDLIQQAHELALFNEDRMLAERIAIAEDSDVDVDQEETLETSRVAPESKGKRSRNKRKKKKRKQQGEVDQSSTGTHIFPQPSSVSSSTGTKQIGSQHGPLPTQSAWAKGPPLRVLAASIENEMKEILPKKDPKGKGKERLGGQTARNATSHPLWQTGETPLSGANVVFGSLTSGSGSASAPTKVTAETLAFGSLASEPSSASVRSPPQKTVQRPTGHDCVICQDPIYGAEIRAPCDHYYDISCVTDLFKSATRDETLFPPRCCKQIIPLTQVQCHLSQALVTTFKEKEIEFRTLKRVYCSSPTCSRFLGPLSEGDSANKVYTCPASGCGRLTCGKCRERYDGGWIHVCRPDAGAVEVLELSRASGWSRCPGCSQMIELHVGCFHMTCRCRTEFCYLCRARWKTCSCPQWDEDRLLAAAEHRVNAQLGDWQQVGRPAAAGRRGPRDPPPLPPRRNDTIVDHFPALPTFLPVDPAPRTPPFFAHFLTASGSTGRLGNTTAASTVITRAPNAVAALTSTSTSTSRGGHWRKTVDDMRERMIREMMERLRIDHECDHIRWQYQDGGGHCEHCGYYLPLYLFRCHDCEMLACNRCRRNRL